MEMNINELPVEVMSRILVFLDNKEKLKVRLVCKQWGETVDQHVPFHISISDDNYEEIRHQFAEADRRVTSMWISNYSRPTFPIRKLSCLKQLGVSIEVNKLAVTEILSRVAVLESLRINVEHSDENTKRKRTPGSPNVEGLKSIKHLRIGYYHCAVGPRANQTVWNQLLNEDMPNVETLALDLRPYFPLPFGFEFFDLVAGFPKLNSLRMNVSTSRMHNVIPRQQASQDLPFTPEIREGLRNIKNLHHLAASCLEKDMQAWRVLFADQWYMRSLCLFIDRDQNQGFPLSLIQPILKKSCQNLEVICLKIDTRINGDLNMELFSQLKVLRSLKLTAWPKLKFIPKSDTVYPKVKNCSSVISEILETLSVDGFEFTEEEIIKVVKNLLGRSLDGVQISPRYAATWNTLNELLREMEITDYGNGRKVKMIIEPGLFVMKSPCK